MTYQYTVEHSTELESYVMDFYGDLVMLNQAENLVEAQAQAQDIVREWTQG